MSTISLHQRDQSDALCRRFALLASSYLEAPANARATEARVPLENLFRILQMFRYDAFSDERRSGVLAVQESVDQLRITVNEENWHDRIKLALTNALNEAFRGVPTPQAIEQVQATLRWLVTSNDEPPQGVRTQAKFFLDRLVTDLG